MYDPDIMSQSRREEFFIWYNEQVADNYVFNFRKEMHDYCSSDVDILQRSCMKFRKLFLDITSISPTNEKTGKELTMGIDPFNHITIASACMATYRFRFITETHLVTLAEENEPQMKKSGRLHLKKPLIGMMIMAKNSTKPFKIRCLYLHRWQKSTLFTISIRRTVVLPSFIWNT